MTLKNSCKKNIIEPPFEQNAIQFNLKRLRERAGEPA